MRLVLLDHAHRAAHHVHLDALAAVLAAEVLVEEALETVLPDHLPAAVPALPELVVARLAHVAQQVRGEAAVRVDALRLDLGDHAGELELPLLDLGHVLEREPAANAHGQERVDRHTRRRLLELLKGDPEERGHAAQHRVAGRCLPRKLAGDQRERERRAVVHERHAVAVVEDAARRRDRTDAEPVLVARVEEAPALEHLEVPELADQDEEGRRDRGGHDRDAPLPGVAAPRQPSAGEDAVHRDPPTTCARAGTRSTRGPRRAGRRGSRCTAPAGARRRTSAR